MINFIDFVAEKRELKRKKNAENKPRSLIFLDFFSVKPNHNYAEPISNSVSSKTIKQIKYKNLK